MGTNSNYRLKLQASDIKSLREPNRLHYTQGVLYFLWQCLYTLILAFSSRLIIMPYYYAK